MDGIVNISHIPTPMKKYSNPGLAIALARKNARVFLNNVSTCRKRLHLKSNLVYVDFACSWADLR